MGKAIVIRNGTVQAVDAPAVRVVLSSLGEVTKTRASHVVPLHLGKRVAFRALRAIFPDTSKVAGWTRTWVGPWVSDLGPSGGPVLGPFMDRGEAIGAEVRWLNQSFLLGRRGA